MGTKKEGKGIKWTKEYRNEYYKKWRKENRLVMVKSYIKYYEKRLIQLKDEQSFLESQAN